MKKFKEKIKKITNKNYCFLALLLAGLLIFGIISQVKDKNIIKASAEISTNNEYIVNGYKFTYKTSMNDLKKNGLFAHKYARDMLMLQENTEGVAQVIDRNYTSSNGNYNELFTFYETNDLTGEIKEVPFIIGDEEIVYNDYNDDGTPNLNEGIQYYISDIDKTTPEEGQSFFIHSPKITINLQNYYNWNNSVNGLDGKSDLYGGVLVQLCYLKNDIIPDNNKELFDNAIYYNYYLSKPVNFTFDLPVDISNLGYDCRAITIIFENKTINNSYFNYERVANDFYDISKEMSYSSRLSTYEDLRIWQNNEAYIVSTQPKYIYELQGGEIFNDETKLSNDEITYYPNIFTGDYILNYESYPYTTFRTWESISNYLTFGNQTPISGTGNLFQLTGITTRNSSNFYLEGQFDVDIYNQSQEIDFVWDKGDLYKVERINGDRTILNVLGVRSLSYAKEENTITEQIYELDYSIINTLISDKVTGLEFIEKVQPEKPQDNFDRFKNDFFNFVNSTAFGAAVGFLIGLLVGHPLIGAGIGAAIGAGVAVIPLIGDFLEAIGIPNNIGDIIRDNVMPNIPQIIPNPTNPSANPPLGLPWWAILLIVVILSALIYIFNNYLNDK